MPVTRVEAAPQSTADEIAERARALARAVMNTPKPEKTTALADLGSFKRLSKDGLGKC
jgi:hypothetical protein